MAKRFTPVIGLAVVVALALVAVFGAMSLTNPAFAAVGAPADAELAEREFSPQVAQMIEADVYIGEEENVDLIPYLDGREDDVTDIDVGMTGTPDDVVTFAVAPGRSEVSININNLVAITEANLSDAGRNTSATSLVEITIGEGDDEETVSIFLTANLKAATPATVSDKVQGTVTLPLGEGEGADQALGSVEYLRVDDLFVDGKGEAGMITSYNAGSSDDSVVVGQIVVTGVGELEIRQVDGSTEVTGAEAHIDLDDVDTAGDPATGDGIEDEVEAALGSRVFDDFPVFSTVDNVVLATGYIVLYSDDEASTNNFSTITVTGEEAVLPAVGPDPSRTFLAIVGTTIEDGGEEITEDDGIRLPYFTQDSDNPGDSTNFTVAFRLDKSVNTRRDDLIIEFHEDYGIPSTMRNTSIAITTDIKLPLNDTETDVFVAGEITFTPEDVTVDGEKILISVGDIDERDDMSEYDFTGKEKLIVHFRQSAGITTPTEVGGYNLVGVTFGDFSVEYDENDEMPAGFETMINRKISRDEEDGGLGKVVTATGKGYKNGTSLTVFLDSLSEVMWDDPDTSSSSMVRVDTMSRFDEYKAEYEEDSEIGNIDPSYVPLDENDDPLHYRLVSGTGYVLAPNRLLEAGEDVLCVDADINSDDVGSCEFTVTHPTFAAGLNYINAVDGKNGYAKPTTFLLKASYPGDAGRRQPW